MPVVRTHRQCCRSVSTLVHLVILSMFLAPAGLVGCCPDPDAQLKRENVQLKGESAQLKEWSAQLQKDIDQLKAENDRLRSAARGGYMSVWLAYVLAAAMLLVGLEIGARLKRGLLSSICDKLWPHCSACGHRLFVRSDAASKLQLLKRLEVYQPAYDAYNHLCTTCWTKIATVRCDLCRRSLSVLDNQLGRLTKNLKEHSVVLDEVSPAKRVCQACCVERLHCFCSRCSRPFPNTRDTIAQYRGSAEVAQRLAPYHKDYQTDWSHLCPECCEACQTSCKDVQTRLSQWVGSTRGEYIKDFRTVSTLTRVEYEGEECETPEQVEEWLKLYTVQLGGNAFVKYFYDKHEEHHSDDVLAGHSPRGNPYYKTEYRVEKWYTGYATAVVVEPFARKVADGPISQQVKHVVLDGLNICCWANPDKREPDLRILLTLSAELTRKRIPFLAFFDANTSHLLSEHRDDETVTAYKRIVGALPDLFVEVPGRIRADDFILQRANNDNSHIISNDQFRDFADRYPWLSTEVRLIKGAVAGDRLTIPQLDLDLRIMPDAAATADSLIKTIAEQDGEPER